MLRLYDNNNSDIFHVGSTNPIYRFNSVLFCSFDSSLIIENSNNIVSYYETRNRRRRGLPAGVGKRYIERNWYPFAWIDHKPLFLFIFSAFSGSQCDPKWLPIAGLSTCWTTRCIGYNCASIWNTKCRCCTAEYIVGKAFVNSRSSEYDSTTLIHARRLIFSFYDFLTFLDSIFANAGAQNTRRDKNQSEFACGRV